MIENIHTTAFRIEILRILHGLGYKENTKEIVNDIYQRIEIIQQLGSNSPLLTPFAILPVIIYITLRLRSFPFDLKVLTDILDSQSLNNFNTLFFQVLRQIPDNKFIESDLGEQLEKVTLKEYKINNYLTLKLRFGMTHIFVNEKRFLSCMFLLLNVPIDSTLAPEIALLTRRRKF